MRGFEAVTGTQPQLPTRADDGSAGNDFYSPIDFTLEPNGRIIVMSNVKAFMLNDEVLKLYIRSSVGIKRHVVLPNGTGIIDSTYYNNPDNEGNIGIALWNTSKTETVTFKKGERICQGIFTKYLKPTNDNVLNKERTGGFGSSGK